MSVTITFEPSGVSGMVATGTYLIDAAKRLGAPVGVGCMRGKAECATCVVKVTSGSELLSPPGTIEQTFLSQEQLDQSLRLVCHAKLEGDGEVVVRAMRQQARAKPSTTPDVDVRQQFGNLPLEKKISTLLHLEAMTVSEAFNAAIDKPLAFGAKTFDRFTNRAKASTSTSDSQNK
ncbi:MAG TPA: 2Fe-2S iron-sulfur cluster binding domain-containing protein [Pyrinomonadaceae bacterium]|nr:2Fe-2S iron-sulfur cluster binding domain-containing protein [Pyrinomonadaceae bacterium]